MMLLMPRRLILATVVPLVALICGVCASAQVIEYEAGGRRYQTLTRNGLTVIMTHLPAHVAGFALVQVSIENGSGIYWSIQPEAFSYVRTAGPLNAISAGQVIDVLLEHGNHNDVVKLVTSYEAALYGIPGMRANNGFEQRRQNALSTGTSPKLQAAAMASAIALASARVAPGQSTDGAVFIPVGRDNKTLSGGRLVFRAEGQVFEFKPD